MKYTGKFTNSNRPVIIYISAAPDLMAEREALARMIAELPVTLAWHIGQTPAAAEPLKLEDLQAVDLYFLIMGTDIRAPVGLELHMAQRANRSVVGFLKRGVTHTPAGQVFSRQARVSWRPFGDAADLRQQVQRLITEYLLRHAIDYALTPTEVTQLEELLTADTSTAEPVECEGTGHSAVLLSRERYIPSQGTIIEPHTSTRD